jgi:O-antigen/teichoic acid export membrane protein
VDLQYQAGRTQLAIIKRIIPPSIKWALTSLGALLILQTDNIIISFMIGADQIPGYEGVSKIATSIMGLCLLIPTISSPSLSRAYSGKDFDYVRTTSIRNVKISLTMMVILSSFIVINSKEIISWWLGDRYFVGNYIVWTILTMAFLEIHHVTLAISTMAIGKIEFAFPALLSGLINIVVSIILAKYYGLLGVALGTLISQALTNNWYVPYRTLKNFDIRFTSYARSVLLPVGAGAALVFGLSYLINNLWAAQADLASLSIRFILISLFGLSIAYVLVLNVDERKFIARYFSGLSPRPNAR